MHKLLFVGLGFILGMVFLTLVLIKHHQDYGYTLFESDIPASSLPDPIYNPGEVRDMDAGAICDTTWSDVPRRIYDSHKEEVSEHYNIDFDTERQLYEYDHLIPRCLGGADSVANLFPLPREGDWNAYDKNRLERRACIMVCKDQLDLKRTQKLFAANWIQLYKEVFRKK